ncbi:MAG: DUF362 domain-containing protein [Candidatus Krumholzibacteriia bacterium]
MPPSCPRRGHAAGSGRHDAAPGRARIGWRPALPLAGLLALLWFVLRVGPKPSRASYPCQRAALPLAAGFLVWLAGLVGSVVALRRGRTLWRGGRLAGTLGCLLIAAVMGGGSALVPARQPARAATAEPNAPLGTAKGLHPGRVVWTFDPAATPWAGPGYGHWWEPAHTPQAAVDGMLSRTLRRLTGAATDAAAWDALFRDFNATHGRGDVGYRPGEKIVVKTNFVGCHWLWGGVDATNYDLTGLLDYMNTSPQMIVALLRQLVDVAGVAQADIAVGDPNGLFPNQYHDICRADFPDVLYLDHNGGNAAHPRTPVQLSTVPFYWSCRPTGVQQDFLPTHFAAATYLVNLANFKSHASAGVTLCAKNHFGTLIRWPGQSGCYDMHLSLPSNAPAAGQYRALVDLMGHAQTGGKTLLYLVDGLYAGVHPGDAPRRWSAAPFNGNWTSSLFASQDPVAIESVCFDLLQLEGDPRLYPQMPGADDHLHEAALANAPPSGTFYDPDHATGVQRLPSLGVHEHWNDPVNMQYSRNLGTGDGIELVIDHHPTAVPPGPPALGLGLANRPNPFNPRTTISYRLPRSARVKLTIYDVRGARVATLVDADQRAGEQRAEWSGTSDGGTSAPSGVYFARLETAAGAGTVKVTLTR